MQPQPRPKPRPFLLFRIPAAFFAFPFHVSSDLLHLSALADLSPPETGFCSPFTMFKITKKESDLAPFFGESDQIEKLSETKPPV